MLKIRKNPFSAEMQLFATDACVKCTICKGRSFLKEIDTWGEGPLFYSEYATGKVVKS